MQPSYINIPYGTFLCTTVIEQTTNQQPRTNNKSQESCGSQLTLCYKRASDERSPTFKTATYPLRARGGYGTSTQNEDHSNESGKLQFEMNARYQKRKLRILRAVSQNKKSSNLLPTSGHFQAYNSNRMVPTALHSPNSLPTQHPTGIFHTTRDVLKTRPKTVALAKYKYCTNRNTRKSNARPSRDNLSQSAQTQRIDARLEH